MTAPPPLDRRPLQHVLVATDFTAGAALAAARIVRLPLAPEARLSLLHVLPEDLPRKVRAGVEEAARRQLEGRGAALRKALAASGRPRVEVVSEWCRGRAFVEIVRRARAAGAELIVLGRHGEHPVKDLFVGSTAERVVRVGDLPVLVVSRKASRAYRRPVLAIDLEDAARGVVEVALRLLEPDVTDATLVHAYHVPFEGFITPSAGSAAVSEMRKHYSREAAAKLARFQASLGDVSVRWQASTPRGDPRTAILGELVRRRADLLVVGTHGRRGLSHALVGSVAEWLLRASSCDVLVARSARTTFQFP